MGYNKEAYQEYDSERPEIRIFTKHGNTTDIFIAATEINDLKEEEPKLWVGRIIQRNHQVTSIVLEINSGITNYPDSVSYFDLSADYPSYEKASNREEALDRIVEILKQTKERTIKRKEENENNHRKAAENLVKGLKPL